MNRARPRMHPTAMLTAVVLAVAPAARAATADWPPEWRPFGLQGIVARSIAGTPSVLCAGTAGKGVLCLDLLNPGTGWQRADLAGATPTWIWIDPLRPEVRFAACDQSGGSAPLYRTLDGGATWTPIVNLPTPFGVVPSVYAVQGVAGTSTVFAAGLHVWRTDDLGDTWTLSSLTGAEFSLEIAPADPNAVWAGGETAIFSGFTIRSLDGGATWATVWDSRLIGDNQTADIAAHPLLEGLVLTGHEGFVLRTRDQGVTFETVLKAPARFFLGWDGGNPERTYAGGSPNGGGASAFVSPDFGSTWRGITGTVLAPLTVFRLRGDPRRLGVAYAATDDGVYRFYGGGLPICLDTRGGTEALLLWPGVCPPILSPGPVIQGDAIAADLGAIAYAGDHVTLGEVECLIHGGDIAFTTLDVPEPAPGHAVAILDRLEGATDYGASSDGRPRLPASGDCGSPGP